MFCKSTNATLLVILPFMLISLSWAQDQSEQSGQSGNDGVDNEQHICPKNETFRECATPCEPKCGQKEPVQCIERCDPGQCQCQNGFFRNPDTNTCVRAEDCPANDPTSHTCGRNEEWSTCPTCEPSCAKPNSICAQYCRKPACQCKKRFFRNQKGKCVRDCAGENPCDRVRCPGGTTCVPRQVQCFAPPCPPIAECQPNGGTRSE